MWSVSEAVSWVALIRFVLYQQPYLSLREMRGFLLETTRFKFSVEKCHNAHRNSNYHYTVFRLSTVALLVPRVSCCILAAINRAILLCSPSNAGILMNWSLSYLLVFCCFNLFLWQRLIIIIQLSLGLYVNVFCVINITQVRKKCP